MISYLEKVDTLALELSVDFLYYSFRRFDFI